MANLPYIDISTILKELDKSNSYLSKTDQSTEVSSTAEAEKKTEVPKTNRCSHAECKKKLLLTDLLCKCGKKYCSGHRQPELHSCTYDYKSSGRALLSTMLVKSVSDSLKDRI